MVIHHLQSLSIPLFLLKGGTGLHQQFLPVFVMIFDLLLYLCIIYVGQQGLREEIVSVYHQHMHLPEQNVDKLHIDVFEIVFYALESVLDVEDQVS